MNQLYPDSFYDGVIHAVWCAVFYNDLRMAHLIIDETGEELGIFYDAALRMEDKIAEKLVTEYLESVDDREVTNYKCDKWE